MWFEIVTCLQIVVFLYCCTYVVLHVNLGHRQTGRPHNTSISGRLQLGHGRPLTSRCASWINQLVLPGKLTFFNIAVTEIDFDPKVRQLPTTVKKQRKTNRK